MSFSIIYFLYSYMDCESAINIYIYNTPPWAPAGGGQEGALAPPENSKI